MGVISVSESAAIRRRQRIARVLIVIGLLLLAGALRLSRLEQLPPGLFIDEAANGMDALGVLQGQHALFFPENQGREGMVIYATALAIAALGRTIMAVRLPAALASVGTVLAVFWLGQVLFTERRADGEAPSWRGLFVGGAAAGLLAVSLGATIIGRDSFRANFLPLFLALSIGFLWTGMRQRSLWRLALAGIFTGLLVYTYIAARFTPLLLLVLGLSFLWPAGVRPANVRRYLPLVAFFLAIAGLVALPLVVDFALHPEYFGSRSSRLFIFDPLVNKGHPVQRVDQQSAVAYRRLGIHRRSKLPAQLRQPPVAQPAGGALLLDRAAGGADSLASAGVPAAADLACCISAPRSAGL